MTKTVFISSVQSEFAEERQALKAFVRGDALLGRHFDVFLFEDQPAQSRSPSELYLDEVDGCDVYLALLGSRYGFEDAEGVSPTEREFDRAVERRKHRLTFIQSGSDVGRHAKEASFITKIEGQVTRRTFAGVSDLTGQVYAALIRVLEEDHILASRPFDAQPAKVGLSELDPEKLRLFLARADGARNFSLKRADATEAVLRHLNLWADKHPTNAALLLFGRRPKAVAAAAETKCLHYGGSQERRPALSYQLFEGALTDQIDDAVGFVMARLARGVGVRTEGAQAPVTYEIPRAAVSEAIVNAVAHRDYTACSAVQVTVLSDRVEVSNPGELPRGLTPEQLRLPHPSIPRNPLIGEVLFLAGYIEKAGTGTLDMIAHCRDAGLPEPRFAQRGDQWVVTLWRDWLTPDFIAAKGLNSRQSKALEALRSLGYLTNSTYREAASTTAKTAARDLSDLVEKGVLQREGSGRGARYIREPGNGT